MAKPKVALLLSLVLHLALLLLLSAHMLANKVELSPPAEAVVAATTINSRAVQQQVLAIQQRASSQQRSQTALLAKLKTQARDAKRQRIKEQRALSQARAALLQVKKKAAAEALAARRRSMAQLKKQALQLQQQRLSQQLAADRQNFVKRAASAKRLQEYARKIKGVIASNWNIPPGASPELRCVFAIHFAPDGSVLSLQLVSSSGNAALDEAARIAILKSAPLPVPAAPADFAHFRLIHLSLSPKQVGDTEL